MDTTLARPPIGQLLDGRYRVESHLAHGGMATVYLGTDTRLDRTVALKIMHAEFANDEDFVRRFVGEARSVARLSHPNVVTVFDQGADGRTLYLAMEYVPGRTLRDVLRERGRLSPREALDIMDGLLSGLAAAHDAGIAHRDVKPENVLLGEGRTIKVADFGLARLFSQASHTKTGMIIGTAAYLAPEQVSRGAADARTDVYAAGVMLYELLTGGQPHTGDSPLAVAYKHVNDVVPAPSGMVPGLPPALDALVALATSRDPELRPADAGQFLRAITGVRSGLPLGAPPAPLAGGPAAGRVDASADDTMPPAFALPVAWQRTAEAPRAEAARDLIPGMGPPPPARQSFGVPQNGADRPGGTRQWPPRPDQGGAHKTLIVSQGDGPYPPAARRGFLGPREPGLQRLLFSRRLAYVAITVAVLLVAGGLAWWVTQGRYTTVPRVGDMPAAAAQAELRDAGLTVVTGKAQLDNFVAKGQVIRTIPAAGARIARGGRVTLIVSAGPHMVTMPQVTGQPLANAKAAIQHAGMVLGKVKQEPSATIPAGIVISTNPAADTSWPQNKPVSLSVSAGPPVPNFVGSPKSVAEGWAAANGVSLDERTAHKSNQPVDTVIHQSVPPGSPFTKGQVIVVVISAGPPQVNVPNVDGMQVRKAIRMLERLGFDVTVHGLPIFRTVTDYNPKSSAPKGSVITLTTIPFGIGGGG